MVYRFVRQNKQVVAALVAVTFIVSAAFTGIADSAGASSSSDKPRDVAVAWAKQQIGKPYAWGGTGPSGFDCSGLTMQAWAAAGIELPRTANAQSAMRQRVQLSELQTGDIVSWGSNPNEPNSVYHVAMYANDGIIVDSPRSGRTVQLRHLDSMSHNLMPYGIRPAA